VPAIIIVVTFAFWVYAFSGLAKQAPVDKLGDPTFSRLAVPICTTAMDQIEALPKANTAKTPTQRADTIEQANGILTGMVAQLRTLPVAEGADQKLANAWLADWDALIVDRHEYAQAVRRDPKAQFYVDERDGQAITEPMDNLAAVNHMAACSTPDDVG
jgi:hypothetical protein